MNEKNVCLFPVNKQVSLLLSYRYHLYSYSEMESCSVGSILNLECGTGKNNSYFKIDIDELPLGQVELLCIRSKIDSFAGVVDLCPSLFTKLWLRQICMKYLHGNTTISLLVMIFYQDKEFA